MRVYHFTFHAYGTWLPDRAEGYFVRGEGYRGSDAAAADRYKKRMKEAAVKLGDRAIALCLETLIEGQRLQRFELFAMAADASHLHVLVKWDDERDAVRVRGQIKSSLTRALNAELGRRRWFVAKAGQTAVDGEEHLHELVHCYLPKHGFYWCCRG